MLTTLNFNYYFGLLTSIFKKSPDNICCIHRAAQENNIFSVENRREHTKKDTINPTA